MFKTTLIAAALASAVYVAAPAAAAGQVKIKPRTPPTTTTMPAPASSAASATPAYAEVLLRRAEATAELEGLLLDYTDAFPKVKELRFEVAALQKELARLNAVPAADAGRLSAALGKLMVRKCALQTELDTLLEDLGDAHPDIKRARRKVEIFEAAIVEILGK